MTQGKVQECVVREGMEKQICLSTRGQRGREERSLETAEPTQRLMEWVDGKDGKREISIVKVN